MCLGGDSGEEKIKLGLSSAPLKTIIGPTSAYLKAASGEDYSARKTCHSAFRQRSVPMVSIQESPNDWDGDGDGPREV